MALSWRFAALNVKEMLISFGASLSVHLLQEFSKHQSSPYLLCCTGTENHMPIPAKPGTVGPIFQQNTLDLTIGFTCHSTFSIRHYRELNSRSWGVEHSPEISLYNIPEMGVHFILNVSALKISMQKVNWRNNFRKAWLFVSHELYLEIPLALNLVGRVVHNANLPTISGPELSVLKSQDVPVPKAGTPIRSFRVHFHHLISNFVNASWPQRTVYLPFILSIY